MTCGLEDLPAGSPARIISMKGEEIFTRGLMNLGLSRNSTVQVIKKLFFGCNYIIKANNEYLVLRKHEAQCLRVTTLS